ncbi:uncharacterized protein LOC130135833 [Syzygium oleosum]|uniref:uncharacterized protein LOC130135833 n=1 Tax=Syzygium oleosum TaxID=219896 RepID=UPI0024BB13BD|nr:uncharacterized protein LOC130135833 [Syzygium oleosum]
MVEVMEVGVWDIAGKPMFLQKWHPHIRLERAKVTSVPIWVRLYNVPHVLWTKKGLSYVYSVLGRPLYMDSATEQKRRLSYAKVCIRMNVDSSFPRKFDIDMGKGGFFEATVHYSWLPVKCKTCNIFGHKDCRATGKEIWVPKTQKNVAPPNSVSTHRGTTATEEVERVTPVPSNPSPTPKNIANPMVTQSNAHADVRYDPSSLQYMLVGRKERGSNSRNKDDNNTVPSDNRFAPLEVEATSDCSVDTLGALGDVTEPPDL